MPSRTSCARSSTTVRGALEAEGLDVVEREPLRVPALVGVVAEEVDAFLQAAGRYVQAVHVLGELKDTIACDIVAAPARARLRAADRRCSTACGRASAGASSEATRSDGPHRSSSPAAAATSARSSSTRRSARGDRVRVLRPQPAGAADGRRRVRRRRRARPRRRARARATASTSCSTTSRRCRWRRTATCSGRSTSSAPPTCSSAPATRASRKVVHTSSSAIFGIPESNPVDRGRTAPAARGVRPGQAAGRAAVPRGGGGRARRDASSGPARSSGTAGSASWPSCSSSSPRARRCSCSARGDNRYQFVHADDLADAVPARRRPRRSRDLQHRRDRVRHDARDAPGARRPRRHRVARSGRCPSAPARARRCRRWRRSGWRRSRRTTGCSTASRCGSTRPRRGPSSAGQPRHSNASMVIESYEWFLAHRDDLGTRHGSHHQSPVRLGLLRGTRPIAVIRASRRSCAGAHLRRSARLRLSTRASPGQRPDLRRSREHRRSSCGATRGRSRRRHPRRRRQQPRRHRRHRRARRPRSSGNIEVLRRPAKTGPRQRVPCRVRASASTRATTSSPDRRRPLARPGRRSPSCSTRVDAGADLAIGSRYVPGGEIPHWPWFRRALSQYGQPLRAARCSARASTTSTAGYRAYRATMLEGDRLRDDARERLPASRSRLAYRVAPVGRPHRRGADRVHRPCARPLEDVVSVVAEEMTLVTWWGLRDRVNLPDVPRPVLARTPGAEPSRPLGGASIAPRAVPVRHDRSTILPGRVLLVVLGLDVHASRRRGRRRGCSRPRASP